MERGLYAAASGMIAQQTIQDTLAQNIANANTVGYKQDNQTFSALHGMALSRLNNGSGKGPQIGELGLGVAAAQPYTDWQPGALSQTNNPLDASLGANQFFAVRTARGERYTRAGNLQIDGAGNLTTASGLPILNANGQTVNVAGQTNIALDTSGNLTANGQPIAKLRVVQATPNGLIKEGSSLYAAKAPNAVTLAARPQVNPGTLEQSNVNPVTSLVQLISVGRSFDMAQKAITTQDELLQHAANDIGHVEKHFRTAGLFCASRESAAREQRPS